MTNGAKMLRTLSLASLLFVVAGCANNYHRENSNYTASQESTNTSQQEQICQTRQALPAEIKDLSIALYYAEQKLAEVKSNSDLLLNPAGWLNAANNEQKLESERNRISQQLEIKKNLYSVLSQSHSSSCSQTASSEPKINQYCEIMSLVAKEMTTRRDKGISQEQALSEIPSITSQVDNHLATNGALNETTTNSLNTIVQFIYKNTETTPEIIYSSFRKGCS
jgi:hypothetical protein